MVACTPRDCDRSTQSSNPKQDEPNDVKESKRQKGLTDAEEPEGKDIVHFKCALQKSHTELKQWSKKDTLSHKQSTGEPKINTQRRDEKRSVHR